jgi:hypothetical protein
LGLLATILGSLAVESVFLLPLRTLVGIDNADIGALLATFLSVSVMISLLMRVLRCRCVGCKRG